MLTDQWYVRADVLAKPAVEAVENGRHSVRTEAVRKHVTSPGCAIFRTGVSLVSCGGVTVSRHGTDEAGNVYVGRNEDEVRKENNLGADVALRQDEDVLPEHLALLRAVALLHARLAGKYRRPASVPPNQRDGIWFRHHLLLDCPHDHDDHALHQR